MRKNRIEGTCAPDTNLHDEATVTKSISAQMDDPSHRVESPGKNLCTYHGYELDGILVLHISEKRINWSVSSAQQRVTPKENKIRL